MKRKYVLINSFLTWELLKEEHKHNLAMFLFLRWKFAPGRLLSPENFGIFIERLNAQGEEFFTGATMGFCCCPSEKKLKARG